MHLKESLCTSFVVYKRTIGLSKCSCRNKNMRFFGGGMRCVVDDNDLFTFSQELIDDICFRMAVQIIFYNDHRISMIVDDGVEGRIEAVASHHCEAHRITFRQG